MSAWWDDAVVYQVYPRCFADSNGDGVGDLAGVIGKLGYLSDLGVDAIWLNPFYPSPMVDGGYDVKDYRGVDPRFGTLEDFDTLVREAHSRRIRVIVDIVPHHTSAEHPWFLEALSGHKRGRYHFQDEPNDWTSVFGGAAWSAVPDGQWYLHRFHPAQPDLNWDNLEVRREFMDILRFWLDRGVDGFRVDVADGLVKAPGLPDIGATGDRHAELLEVNVPLPYTDQDGVHEIYREWRALLNEYEAMAVAEVWVHSAERLARYLRPDELHQAFNFDFMLSDFDAMSFRHSIQKAIHETEIVGAKPCWVLSNHDKPRHVTRFGSLARAKAATLLMLSLPGSAYLYNGEELGLDEVSELPPELIEDPAYRRTGISRDGCRVPLPWGASDPWVEPYLPQPERWDAITADKQDHDPDSTLNFYRRAIRLRRDLRGEIQWCRSQTGVLCFQRGHHHVVLNTSPQSHLISGTVIVSSGPLADPGQLPPDTAVWLSDH